MGTLIIRNLRRKPRNDRKPPRLVFDDGSPIPEWLVKEIYDTIESQVSALAYADKAEAGHARERLSA